MNNARIQMEDEKPDLKKEVIFREKVEQLTSIIEALQNVAASSHWTVLKKYVFDVELSRSKSRLETESDTTEIFRLQGETRIGRRYNLEKLLTKYRDELQVIRKKLNE